MKFYEAEMQATARQKEMARYSTEYAIQPFFLSHDSNYDRGATVPRLQRARRYPAGPQRPVRLGWVEQVKYARLQYGLG
jgi:hypothetical protein